MPYPARRPRFQCRDGWGRAVLPWVLAGQLAVLLAAGCRSERDGSSPEAGRPRADRSTGDRGPRATSLRVDGPVVDLGEVFPDGQPIRHSFTVMNTSGREISLIHGEAAVPCCSSIGPLPDRIPPGGRVTIPVEFRPGFEDVERRLNFRVATDPREASFELTLIAHVRSSCRIVESGGSSTSLAVGESGRRTFQIVCQRRGTKGLGPPTAIEVSGGLGLRRLGPEAGTTVVTDGVSESTCEVEVAIPASREIGVSRANLVCRWPDGKRLSHLFAWEVTPSLRASPTGLVLRSSKEPGRARISIRSSSRPFRILGVSGPLREVPAGYPGDPSRDHSLDLLLDPARLSGRTPGGQDITVTTDDPDQPVVKISVLALPGD